MTDATLLCTLVGLRPPAREAVLAAARDLPAEVVLRWSSGAPPALDGLLVRAEVFHAHTADRSAVWWRDDRVVVDGPLATTPTLQPDDRVELVAGAVGLATWLPDALAGRGPGGSHGSAGLDAVLGTFEHLRREVEDRVDASVSCLHPLRCRDEDLEGLEAWVRERPPPGATTAGRRAAVVARAGTRARTGTASALIELVRAHTGVETSLDPRTPAPAVWLGRTRLATRIAVEDRVLAAQEPGFLVPPAWIPRLVRLRVRSAPKAASSGGETSRARVRLVVELVARARPAHVLVVVTAGEAA